MTTAPVPVGTPTKAAATNARSKSKPVPEPKSSPTASQTPQRSFGISEGTLDHAQKIVVYGPGGVGKTELASLLVDADVTPVFVDLEDGSRFLNVSRIDPTPETFEETLDAVRAVEDSGYDALVLDSLTKAEELCIEYTLRTVKGRNKPDDPGRQVLSIEGYGWGKGYTHVYEQFLKLLQALDALARKGKHIITTCHDCTANVPNPGGDDWIRYEPRLQNNNKGMIRQRVKEWCDHLFYIGFDAFVADGKAQGSGTRTIYPTERPTHWAKSRKLSETIAYPKGDATLWHQLFLSEE